MKTTQKLSDKIQKIIDNFATESEPFWVTGENSEEKLNLRKIAAELKVLPIAFDWFAGWGIQSDGSILSFTFDKPYKIEIVENRKIINMIFFDAANKYSELSELMPVRNPESIVCPGCDGTGILKEFADNEFLAKSIRCNCGGVGWLPNADPEYLYF